MSRNYGIGSRDMFVAGRMVLNKKSPNSFKTQQDYINRWRLFCNWASEQNIKKMENVTQDVVIDYGKHLQSQLVAGLYSSASAPKNYVSAVNAVMKLATGGKWQPVSPGNDCRIQRRVYIPKENKATTENDHKMTQSVSEDRISVLLGLQRAFGLRFKESSLLNAKAALKESNANGFITVTDGTKGGRKRTVPCRQAGFTALEKAIEIQDGNAMIPRVMDYNNFRRECYQVTQGNGLNFHSERHAYAQERYREITGAPSPIEAAWPRNERFKHLAEYLGITEEEARKLDNAARQTVSVELGHSRVEITNAYLG